jgi:hypothetical protein
LWESRRRKLKEMKTVFGFKSEDVNSEEYKCPYCENGMVKDTSFLGLLSEYTPKCPFCRGTGERQVTIALREYDNLRNTIILAHRQLKNKGVTDGEGKRA